MLKTLINKLNPLTWNVPIANKDGTPTNEFMRKWAQQQAQNGAIPNLTDAAGVSAVLDELGAAVGDILVRTSTGWAVLPAGATNDVLESNGPNTVPSYVALPTIQALLDSIGSTRGSILYRGAGGWAIRVPNTAGFVLTDGGAGADPTWAAGGSSLLTGAGVPTTLEPAGTLYSQTDADAVWSSQPTPSNPTIVQSLAQDNHASPPYSGKGVTFGTAVTAGNLLIAVLSDTGGTAPAADTGWALENQFANSTNVFIAIYTRTAAGGDGVTPPQIVTFVNSSTSCFAAWEIDGATWTSLDGAVVGGTVASPGGTTVMSSFTPSISTDLVLTVAVQAKIFGAQNTVGTPFTLDSDGAFFEVQEWLGHDVSPPSGTPIAATITWDSGVSFGLYVVFGLKGAGLVANWELVGPEPKASSTVFGVIKVDGTSVTAASGVVSAASATRACVRLASNQGVSTGVWTKILFDTVVADPASMWVAASHWFKPPAGTYLLTFTGLLIDAASATGGFFVVSEDGLHNAGGDTPLLTAAVTVISGSPTLNNSADGTFLIITNGTHTYELDVDPLSASPSVSGATTQFNTSMTLVKLA